VGTEPGRYTTTVNVGNQLQFVFQNAEPGQSYYFAVASYASGGVVGPLSAEVSGRIDGSLPLPDSGDVSTPAVVLTMPTSSSELTTSKSSVLLGGIATDDQGVTAVRWTNDRGGSGVATGTEEWMAAVPVRPGQNLITITAVDGNSNSGSIRVSIYRTESGRLSPSGPRTD
jgi:hypothetical protein